MQKGEKVIAQLDTKTVYSFMSSVVTLKDYVEKAKSMGYESLGIMDVDNLYGAYEFIEACEAAHLNPLIGLEIGLELEEQTIPFRLLALSTQGYQNLMKISTCRMMGKNSWEDVKHLMQHVAVIVPAPYASEELPLSCDYYIGVFADTPAASFTHPVLPLHTVRYFERSDLEALQMLAAIKENQTLTETGSMDASLALKSPQDLRKVFEVAFPQAVENLEQLVAGIHYQIDTQLKLPRFNPKKPAVEELRELSQAGLVQKNLRGAIYQERLEQELEIIHQMGFDDYFLIVWDLLRFGRSQGYYMGMGRGSAVGSLVAYSLGITGIDPVEKNLLFERFLNVERYTMPDIDIDIPDIYRPEFIRYVRDRYGSYHAAQIVTFSTFGAKQAIRDVFKRFGVPEYELTSITKRIGFRDTLTTAYEKNLAFRQVIHCRTEFERGFEIAKRIEGQPRQTSIHAAGVVMSDQDLTDHIPLKYGEDMFITQYDAHAVEANGLLKMDFLGLRNLTFVQKMKEAVYEKYQEDIRIEAIDLEDPATLALFAAGDTKGIFQFEQAGAIRLLRRVKPNHFEEVVATTSLNRPGASDYIDNFVKRKHSQEKVEILDASIADILEPTYGIMLYQEQVMQVAQRFAGFSLGKADILRRAMGKKNAAEMHRMEDDFIAGAQKLGHTKEKAQEVFAIMEKFAGYGFNRSHAYAYSALAFQMAYFKVHYPDVFFDVMLNYSSSDYLTDALQFDFKVASLSINTIPYRDKFQDRKIYLGMKNIKGFPREFAYWIIDNRPFESVEDFILRLPTQYHKLPLLTPLVELGLFDSFEKNRRKVLQNLPNLLVFADELGSLFGDSSYSWTETEDFSQAEKYEKEQALIGVGLSPHPLATIAQTSPYEIQPISQLEKGQQARILVEVQSIRTIRTKAGDLMAFLQVSDTKKKLDVTLFPETYNRFSSLIKEGGFYYLSGKIQEREGHLQMVLSEAQLAINEKFWIQLADHSQDQTILSILKKYPGPYPVVMRYEDEKKTLQLKGYPVQKNKELEAELKNLVMKTIYR